VIFDGEKRKQAYKTYRKIAGRTHLAVFDDTDHQRFALLLKQCAAPWLARRGAPLQRAVARALKARACRAPKPAPLARACGQVQGDGLAYLGFGVRARTQRRAVHATV